MQEKGCVVVGMSGGVDSSVTAYLLKEQGYRVIGLFMRNWEGECPAEDDYHDVVQVCDKLEIPYYSVNFAKEYWDNVFAHFLTGLKEGFTPNPDILCNREIKFKVLLDKALDLGGDFLATGHYCQNRDLMLCKGADAGKDQSYFLYTMKRELLKKVLFPIGGLQKSEVRKIAEREGLITHDKKDSTGICFIGKRNFREFLKGYIPMQKGPLKTLDGKVVGEHEGAFYYTIGQRKGLGVGGPGEPWFVINKDIETNTVFIGQGEENPALFASGLTANDVSFVNVEPSMPLRCSAKIRYRQEAQPCLLSKENDHLKVKFDTPQRAITPGQSVVFYLEGICLGGAIIKNILQ